MKRSALRRRKGLDRGAPLANSGRVKRANAKRKHRLRKHQHGTTERTRWFREQPCVCQGQHPACTGGWSEPSHVVSRGAGGTASDIVPMSHGCHQAWHDHGQLSYFGDIRMEWDDTPNPRNDAAVSLASIRRLARTHYATQGPTPPGDPT